MSSNTLKLILQDGWFVHQHLKVLASMLDVQVDEKRWDLSEAPPLPHPGDIEQPSSAVYPGYVQSLPSDLSVKTLRCPPRPVQVQLLRSLCMRLK